jgi:uncharacterized repeat protein (TIGR01451 family)
LSADGVAKFTSAKDTVAIGTVALTLAKTHAGTFVPGEDGATFTITVGNTGNAPTNGTLNLSDQLPGVFTMTSFAGDGWTVNGFRATFNMPLAAGQSSVLTMTVNVSRTASGTFTNIAKLLGDGQSVTTSDTVQF